MLSKPTGRTMSDAGDLAMTAHESALPDTASLDDLQMAAKDKAERIEAAATNLMFASPGDRQAQEAVARARASARFSLSVDFSAGLAACAAWIAERNADGYGLFWDSGETWPAHEWLYNSYCGFPPNRLTGTQTCGNHWCVNIFHLEVRDEPSPMRPRPRQDEAV